MTWKHTLIRLLPAPARDVLTKQPRFTVVTVVLVLVFLIAVTSALVGSRIKSPAQLAAEASPPPPGPILVPVEKRILTSDIVTRGTARLAQPHAVVLAPGAARPTEELITSLPVTGAEFPEGSVVFTVAGRPVFVMQGDIPAYRDMTPGTSGSDVHQLERAIKRLGHHPGAIDGIYDSNTAAAVAALYVKAGWDPFEPTPEQLKELHMVTEQLAVAEKDLTVAKIAANPKLVEATRAKAVASNNAAQADVEAKAVAHSTIVEDSSSSSEARAKAQAEFTAAQSLVKTTRREGALAVLAAQNAQKVAQAEAEVAQAQVERLAVELARLKSKTGIQVPTHEIIFVPHLPARIQSVDAKVGDVAKGALLTAASTQVVIDSSLQLSESTLVKPEMPVKIDEPDLGISATGVVTKVADAPGTNGVDAFHVYIEVAVDETPTKLAGTSLRLTIPVKSTKGEVLAVPVSTVSLAADGTSRVQVQRNGSLEYVTVKTGLSAQGFVEVSAVKGALGEGQLVVVGFE